MSLARYYFWGRPAADGRVAVARGSVHGSQKAAEQFGRARRLAAGGWTRYSVKASSAPRAIANACSRSAPALRTNVGQGARVSFHGAFKRRADAERKAAAVPSSFIRPTAIRGQKRFMVLQAINGKAKGGRRRRKSNPPAETEIYQHLREIVAQKGPGHFNCDAACVRANHTYRHVFTSGPPVLGLADGSLAIPAP